MFIAVSCSSGTGYGSRSALSTLFRVILCGLLGSWLCQWIFHRTWLLEDISATVKRGRLSGGDRMKSRFWSASVLALVITPLLWGIGGISPRRSAALSLVIAIVAVALDHRLDRDHAELLQG